MCHPNSSINEYEYAYSFIKNGGDPSWKNASHNHPSLFISYEEIRRTPESFRKIIDFLTPNTFDEERFKLAISGSSFDNMQRLEKKEKQDSVENTIFPGGKESLDSKHYFVNKGSTG